MAFTVGGGDDANSYVSVEYADAYFADRGIGDWTGADSLKQGALVRATDYVKAMFTPRFDPAKVDLAVDPITPDTLLKAVCEYALIELRTPASLTPQPSESGVETVVTKEKLGPLETTYAVLGGTSSATSTTRKSFPIPDALIARLLLPSAGLNRVTR